MFILGVVLAVFIGVSLGLLGGGGSILTLPILLYVFRLPPAEAITASLLVVGATSAASLIPHARAGRVRWRVGLLFGAASMVGAYAGGRASAWLPAGVLIGGFAAMMVVTGVAMLRPRRAPADAPPRDAAPLARVAAQGIAVGAVTGLVGAGGGFMVVPALLLLGRLTMPAAVGTSLFVIALNSVAGVAGHLAQTSVPWAVALPVTAAAIAGSFVGARFVGAVKPEALRRGFGWFVLVMAGVVLAQELPRRLGVPAVAVRYALLVAATAVLTGIAVRALARRHAHA